MYVTENTRDAAQSRWGSTSAFNTAPLTPPPRRLRRYTTEWDVPDMWSFLVAMDLSIDKLPHPATDMMTIDLPDGTGAGPRVPCHQPPAPAFRRATLHDAAAIIDITTAAYAPWIPVIGHIGDIYIYIISL